MTATPEQRLTFGDLADELAALDALVAMDEGEWTDEHEALYVTHARQLATKADAYGLYREDTTQRVARLKARATEAAELARRYESHLKALDSYVILALDHMGKTDAEGKASIVGEVKKINVQLSPPSVTLLDDTIVPELLPDVLTRTIPAKVELDLKAVTAVLSNPPMEGDAEGEKLYAEVAAFAELRRERHIRVYAAGPKAKEKKPTTKKPTTPTEEASA